MNLLTEWIEVKSIDFSNTEKIQLHGDSFKVLPSPNYLPIAVRMQLEEGRGSLQFEFEYLSLEPTSVVKPSQNAEFKYGKHSHKVFHIRLEKIELHKSAIIKELNVSISAFQRVIAVGHDKSSAVTAHCNSLLKVLSAKVDELISQLRQEK